MYNPPISNIQPTRYIFTNHKYIYYSTSPTCFDLLGHFQGYQLTPYDGHHYYEHLVGCIIFLRVSQNSLLSYSTLECWGCVGLQKKKHYLEWRMEETRKTKPHLRSRQPMNKFVCNRAIWVVKCPSYTQFSAITSYTWLG